MPIIGQPAHSHFIPVITPVVLTRISLSVTYLYNVSAAAYRVSLARTYVYDLKVIVSRSQVYLYHVNPLLPVGPTRLYFHAVLNPLPNLPTTERSTLTANKVVDAETVNRTMSTIIGTVQTSLTLTSNATTALQRYYFTRFVSDTLTNVSSITAQTWTYNFSTNNAGLSSRFPVNGTNQPVRVVAYVWRPSTSSKVGDIVDGNSASTVDVPNAAQKAHITTFAGNQVLGVQAGDVLCFEVWFEITQATASPWTDPFFYDGPTVTTVKNTTVSNHASFIQTPQGLSFGAALVRVSRSSIQKYDIIHRTLSSQSYRYNVTALASLAPVYRYNIATRTSLSQIYLYSLIGRLSVPSISKYNILITKTASKIFRYALNSTLQTSRVYRYNIANAVPTVSRIYKYNIANAAQLARVYKYQIYKTVQLSRIYRYSFISRTALSRVYKYNLATAVSLSRIYRYALAVKLSLPLSRAYKYNILIPLSASSHIRYSLLSKLTASKIFKYGIANAVTTSRVYKYNLSALAHVTVSSVYKYNVIRRLSVSRIYGYAIATKLSLSRIYRYNLTRAVPTLSRVYRYPILNAVTRTRTYRYNLAVRILSSHNYLYNFLKLVQKPRVYIYGILEATIPGRISLQSKYVYNIITIPSAVLWQITGKGTDFPDSLENLVRDYIKANWSITDPVLGQTPIITSVISRQHQSQVDNFAYDNFRSYYIRVKEVGSEVKNRQVRLNTYEFSTPVELELFARRLKKSESWPQLNNMVNELVRIFGTYQADQIFGIQGITLDRIGSMEKERPPAKNLWARKLKIILHYYKISVAG